MVGQAGGHRWRSLSLLEELAATTKGQVFTPDQAAELLEKLIAQTATVEHRVDRPFRKSRLTLIVIGITQLWTHVQ